MATARNGAHGPQLDLTIGRIGNRYSGFLRIGGTPGDLHLSGAVYRHPSLNGLYSRFDHYDDYPVHYAAGHYYDDYHTVGLYGYPYRRPYFGYHYTSVYYDEPVVYRLAPPSVVYVENETVYVDDDPDVTVVYDDPDVTVVYEEELPETSALAGIPPPCVTDLPAQQPETDPYPTIGDDPSTVVQEGAAAFAAGHFEKAQHLFIEAVMADERDGYAKLLYGVAAFATGDFRLAGVTIRRALRTSEGLVYRPLDVRTLYGDQSVFKTHRLALLTHVKNYPADRDAKFVLAYVDYATAQPELAAERFGELAAADKNDDLAMRLYETARAVERVVPE